MSAKKCCICCCASLVVLFLIGLAVLFVVRQKVGASIEASYKVTDASLSQFSVGRGNNLAYNLAANMTVQNPNKYATYTYDKFEATASYNDEDLSEVKVPTFDVEKKESTALPSTVFKGEKSLKDVSKIKGGSVYDIVLKIKVKLMSKAGKVNVYNEYKIKCNLKVPLVDAKGKSTAKFEATDCKKDGGTTSGIKM